MAKINVQKKKKCCIERSIDGLKSPKQSEFVLTFAVCFHFLYTWLYEKYFCTLQIGN